MRYEFLPAFKGDCFLIDASIDQEPHLILVDGGPGGTYQQHLRPRLMELRAQRQLEDYEPLVIDLVIVSHVDDDHINGIIALFQEMHHRAVGGENPLFEVRELWHNSFDDILGNNEVAAAAAQFGAASFAPLAEEAEEPEERDVGFILASVAQGQRLRELATSDELNVPINDGFGPLIQTAGGKAPVREVGSVRLTVVGPRPAELTKLQKLHDAWRRKKLEAGEKVTPASVLQALTDTSVANLSSIVLLAEGGGRKALLTGDARSDFILDGLEETGLVPPGGELPVDLLKAPHHGSDRNVDEEFLRRVPAAQYLFSGNGEHGNPERETLRMLIDTRPGAEMELMLTYPVSTIDPARRHEHEKERQKELNRESEGTLDPSKTPRRQWSDPDHGLASLIAALPPNVEVVEPKGPIVEL